MPYYLSQHTLACMTRQAVAELVRQVHEATEVKANRVLLNMQEGKMLVEFEAVDRNALEEYLKAHKIHWDSLLRVEFESVDGTLHPKS